MTDKVTIMRCALCSKSFSYVPKEADSCAPGSKNQICDACLDQHLKDVEHEEMAFNWYYSDDNPNKPKR